MKFPVQLILAVFLLYMPLSPLNAKAKNPQETVAGFLKWYDANYNKAYSFGLINTEGRYTVNLEGCQQYLAFLKSSGYLSDVFLEKMNQHFKAYDAIYKKEFVDDGPPEGFDHDLILLTQEMDEFLEGIKKMRPSDVYKKENIYFFDYFGFSLAFAISPETGLIDSIN